MVEILFSFLIMFAVFTLVVFNYRNYSRPMGFEYENVWVLNYTTNDHTTSNEDSLALTYEMIKRTISSAPEVAGVSFVSNNSPFSMSTSNSNVSHNNVTVMTHQYSTDDDYQRVLRPTMISGRWYGRQDDGASYRPIVINRALKEKFFPNEEAVGKVIRVNDNDSKIVGVVENMKDRGDYKSPEASLFERTNRSSYKWLNRMLIHIKPGADPGYEGRLYNQTATLMKGATVEIEHLSEKRATKNKITLIPLICIMVIAGFLIINVSLGLFGVLWYNISKRRSEIGLRRAIGATGNAISKQIVGETLVLTTLSLLLGLFFAVQFPLLNVFNMEQGTYITAILLALAFIYLLVVICAFYPGRQAANIYPAVALHED